jgi:hypothetical protein
MGSSIPKTLSHFEKGFTMNKEKRFYKSVLKLFELRNLSYDKDIAQRYWSELEYESSDNLKRLFQKLYDRNFYTDYSKTKARMPYVMEIKEILKTVKSDAYVMPDEFCLEMPKEEREKKRQVHLDMTEKIKQFLKNGAKDEELDVIFAQN